MTDGLQMNLMLDVAALGFFGSKKFPARGQVIKQRTHLYLRARGFTAIAHDVELAPVDDDFGPGDCPRLARSQAKPRYTGDAWQRLAPKSQSSHCLKIGRSPNLAGGMPLQRKYRSEERRVGKECRSR